MKKSIMSLVVVGALALAACGSDDDGSSDDSGTSGESDGSGAAADLVPISSLDLDIPFEIPWDLPVPADSTVAFVDDTGGQNNVGLNSNGPDAPIEAEYATWFPATFENTTIDESFGSFQGVEVTDTGSRALSAAVGTCEDCPDYKTRVTLSVFES